MLSASNTFCFIHLPELLSEANVWRFHEAFPEHKDIVETYWKRKHVINFDKVLSRDAEVLLKVIEQCRNLKEVKFSKLTTNRFLRQLPVIIGDSFPALEVLDIPGIPLSDKDLIALRLLSSLKTLNINCLAVKAVSKGLDMVFLNNQQLENVSIIGVYMDTISFKNLSNSVTNLEIVALNSQKMGDLFEHIHKWRLEKLWLPRIVLSKQQVTSLSNLTTLKNLILDTSVESEFIEALLTNNANLERVHINLRIGTSTNFLRSLPKTVKHLRLISYAKIDCSTLIECANTCNLVSIYLHEFTSNIVYKLADFVAAVPLLENFSLNCVNADIELQTLKQLKNLKTLELLNLQQQHESALTEIMSSCLQLEVFELKYVNIFPSEELLSAIANLPVLREISFEKSFKATNYINFITNLSKRNNLTTAKFVKCFGFNNDVALALIRECNSLTSLLIESTIITEDLVHDTARELNKQKNRTEPLYLTMLSGNFTRDLTGQDFHPKLEIKTSRYGSLNLDCV